jgi:hypothetical protein
VRTLLRASLKHLNYQAFIVAQASYSAARICIWGAQRSICSEIMSPIIVEHFPQLNLQPWCDWTAFGLRAPDSTASRTERQLIRLQTQMIMRTICSLCE